MKGLKLLLRILLGITVLLVVALIGLLLFAPGLHLSSLGMILNVMLGAGTDVADDELLARLQVAEGYQVSVYARDIANPRMLQLTDAGRLLVSSPRSGEVLQLQDADGDGAADSVDTLIAELRRPHGLELFGGYLYVAESHRVGRIAYDTESGTVSGSYEPVISGLTDNGNHWSKTIRFSPAGELFLSMGSTCNVCEEQDERRATIMRFQADGSDGEIHAGGLRNSVGMAFAPWDGALYATDNGRDLLGDNYPPCELNRIEQGAFYGWPYLNGDNELDPDFGAGREDLQATAHPPVFNFRAHNAPLGIVFSRGQERSALVALHGSWNRSIPDGYKVVKLRWQADDSISTEDFLWGFEVDGDIAGRPVDISPDGAGGYFISDDYARVIYRITPAGRRAASAAVTDAEADSRPAAAVVNLALAEAGEKIYHSMPCGECHAVDAPTPVPLDKLASRYDTQSLADYFLTPTPPMPLYDLSGPQRLQLAHYLLSRDQAAAGM